MASTMAEALAASLPAPQTGPPAATTTPAESIPPSMSKLVDVEAEIPIKTVELDGMVISKIIKHSQEVRANHATGTLLGIDLDGVLEVSNSFPMPYGGSSSGQGENEEDRNTRAARYQAAMLRSLQGIQRSDNPVGFYVSTTMGVHLSQNLVEMLSVQREKQKLRHGGIAIVHDASQSAHGNAHFRAFRLSRHYLEATGKGRFSSQQLADSGLTLTTILEELPVTIKNSSLLKTYLAGLCTGDEGSKPVVRRSFSALNMESVGEQHRNLEEMLDKLEEYKNEDSNVSYMLRQIAREKGRAEAYVAKRKEENAGRVAQGLGALPEEDVSRMFKIPNEPSRLESLVLLGQVEGLARHLGKESGEGLVRSYAARTV